MVHAGLSGRASRLLYWTVRRVIYCPGGLFALRQGRILCQGNPPGLADGSGDLPTAGDTNRAEIESDTGSGIIYQCDSRATVCKYPRRSGSTKTLGALPA
ncbi:MAG: hypothetical protein ACFFBD_11665 [Candidatus Hodarchaeota archaeon]